MSIKSLRIHNRLSMLKLTYVKYHGVYSSLNAMFRPGSVLQLLLLLVRMYCVYRPHRTGNKLLRLDCDADGKAYNVAGRPPKFGTIFNILCRNDVIIVTSVGYFGNSPEYQNEFHRKFPLKTCCRLSIFRR